VKARTGRPFLEGRAFSWVLSLSETDF